MNKKDAPQIAASNNNRPISASFIATFLLYQVQLAIYAFLWQGFTSGIFALSYFSPQTKHSSKKAATGSCIDKQKSSIIALLHFCFIASAHTFCMGFLISAA